MQMTQGAATQPSVAFVVVNAWFHFRDELVVVPISSEHFDVAPSVLAPYCALPEAALHSAPARYLRAVCFLVERVERCLPAFVELNDLFMGLHTSVALDLTCFQSSNSCSHSQWQYPIMHHGSQCILSMFLHRLAGFQLIHS